jgi:hypothetical protein
MSILDNLDPNSEPDPNNTPEGLEAAFKAKYETPPDEPTVPEGEPTEPENEPSEPVEPTVEPEPAPATATTPATATDTYEIAPGVSIEKERIAAYYRFEQELQTNPAFRDYLSRFPQAQSEALAPASTTPSEPEAPPLDLDDPNIKYLYEQNQALLSRLEQIATTSQTTQEAIFAQQREATANIVERAVGSFQKEHGLSDNEILKVRQIAGNNQWVPIYQSGTDPVTGLPTDKNPYNAVERSLELAMAFVPELQNKKVEAKVEEARGNTTRKKKLAGIGGNSGSVPRAVPKPQTREDYRTAMVKEVAELFRGNTITE